ncbi:MULTISPECIES: metal-sulfur cluster assembly factor [Georgenia]|jgi:metal-sulfur cluster biosynthetic enzyme|uniref:MIP18 family-like domain-containing protein n=1 Tax=Georgenia daeguensis TaxID=908355 RepID=A0ABP8EQN1_9MICO|nr:metal-sulfur cluster assembly factor [Georgenia sp. EYE_87]MCK6212167.1 metal-sulfur cluster assembly factor [Georgenia sp. EYE_87]
MSETTNPATATNPSPTTAADVEEAMRDVIDPELGINVVDLGLVYGITVDQNNQAVIDMTLTSAACPLTDVIEDQAAQALEGLVAGQRINWVWMPPWGPEKITPIGREQLRAIGFNV